ncbi:MAG: cupin domain-containing protein [Gaiellaceae bacterium]
MKNEADADIWEWPDSLDALVAAPEFHSLLFENDNVRVLDTRIGPAKTVPLHTHRWPAVLCVLSSGHLVRRDGEGRVLTDTRAADALPEPGTAFWTPALPPHTVENVDSSEIRLLNIELKHAWPVP